MVGFGARVEGESASVSYRLLSPRRAPERFDGGDGRIDGEELEEYEAFFSDRLASAGESNLLRIDGQRATIEGAAYEVSSVEYFEPVLVEEPYEERDGWRALRLSDEPGPTAVPEVHQYELSLPTPVEEGSLLELKLPGDYKPYGNHSFEVVGAEVDGLVGATLDGRGLELDSMVQKTLLVGLGDDASVSDPGVALAGHLRELDVEPETSPVALEGQALLDRLVDADVLAAEDETVSLASDFADAFEAVVEAHEPVDAEAVGRAAAAAARGGATYGDLAEQLLGGGRVTETELLALIALDRFGVDDELLVPAANALRAFR